MPVRSLSSAVLKWPDRATVAAALAEWATATRARTAAVLRVGYFGSYASGRPGPGSDIDVVMVITSSPTPFERRASEWNLTRLPVPADLLVYTREEWEHLPQESRLTRVLKTETVWV